MKNLYHKAKSLFDRYEHYLMPLAMVVGFIVDNLTLRRIDFWADNLVLTSYIVLVVGSIIYINTHKKKAFQHRFFVWLSLVAPFVMQYAFGGLFSSFMVFYFRSSVMLVSWPLLLLLLGMMLSNELFWRHYERLTVHLSVLYLVFFFYSVFALPMLFNRIGTLVFLASGACSLLLIYLVVWILRKIDGERIIKKKYKLTASIAGIYLLFNLLYFTNLIPPIPLSMKAGGIYHNVTKTTSGYALTYEQPKFYNFWRETAYTYHWQSGGRIYVFSSVFAPTEFEENIYHRWSYYDEQQGKWIEKSRVNFTIYGGIDHGYRGYSYKTNIKPGKWRVDVITDTDQVLGRIRFEVQPTDDKVMLKTKTE
jgi:hypothetical protein